MTEHNNDFAELLQAFFREHLVGQRRVSMHTVKSYRDTWKLFLQFLSQAKHNRLVRIRLEDITTEVVLAFLNDLETTRQCSTRTRNQRLAAIRTFFHYASLCRPERLDQFQRILQISFQRHEQLVFGFLTREEIEAMLGTPNRQSALGRRHATLILFLYNTGARVQEVTGLNVGCIRFEKPPYVRLLGKGSKERLVPLWEETGQRLTEQITEQGSFGQPEAQVFVNRRGERLTRGGVTHILKATQKRAAVKCPSLGKKNLSPHTLRHTTAMHLLQSKVDLNSIRCWLGHVSFQTTNQYVETDLEMKREALAKGGISILPEGPTRWKPTKDILSFLENL